MPCILAHAPSAEATSLISRTIAVIFRRSAERSPNESSLLVGFRCGYCPKGLFAALVVYLLANARSHGHKWVLQKDQVFKDQISFVVRPYDTVTITVQPKFFEISCSPASSDLNQSRHFPLATVCGEVRHCIERGIREVSSTLHYTSDAAHYLAFYCPGDHRGPDSRKPHPAEIHFHYNKPCTLQCELAEGRAFQLPPGHERWFIEVWSLKVITVCQSKVTQVSSNFYTVMWGSSHDILLISFCNYHTQFNVSCLVLYVGKRV